MSQPTEVGKKGSQVFRDDANRLIIKQPHYDLHTAVIELLKEITANSDYLGNGDGIYRRGGGLVRIEAGKLHDVSANTLAMWLSANVLFMAGDVMTPPQQQLIKTAFQEATTAKTIPELRCIVSHPVLAGGELIADMRYDATRRILVAPRHSHNTDMDAAEAMGILDSLLQDVAFNSEADRLAFLAALLMPIVRWQPDGNPEETPLLFVDKPAPGAGASTLAEIYGWAIDGRQPRNVALSHSEEERRKLMTSLLLSDASVFLFDNLNWVGGDVLSNLLTGGGLWADRKLGTQTQITVEHAASWICTGNNVEVQDQMVRRLMPVRLSVQTEQAEQRTTLRSLTDLRQYLRNSNDAIMDALCSLVALWLKAGCPAGEVEGGSFGNFDGAANIAAGVLCAAGCGPLGGNRRRLRSAVNIEEERWRAFYDAVWCRKQGGEWTAADAVKIADNAKLEHPWNTERAKTDAGRAKAVSAQISKRRERVFDLDHECTLHPRCLVSVRTERRTAAQGTMFNLTETDRELL